MSWLVGLRWEECEDGRLRCPNEGPIAQKLTRSNNRKRRYVLWNTNDAPVDWIDELPQAWRSAWPKAVSLHALAVQKVRVAFAGTTTFEPTLIPEIVTEPMTLPS